MISRYPRQSGCCVYALKFCKMGSNTHGKAARLTKKKDKKKSRVHWVHWVGIVRGHSPTPPSLPVSQCFKLKPQK